MASSGLDSLAGRIVLRASGEERIDVVVRKKPGMKLFIDHMEDGSAKDAVRSLGKGDSVSIREGEDLSGSSIRLSTLGGDESSGVFGNSTGRSGSDVFGQGSGYGFDSPFGGSNADSPFENGSSGSPFGNGGPDSPFGNGNSDAPFGGDSPFGNFEGSGNDDTSPFGGSPDDSSQSGSDNPFGNFL